MEENKDVMMETEELKSEISEPTYDLSYEEHTECENTKSGGGVLKGVAIVGGIAAIAAAAAGIKKLWGKTEKKIAQRYVEKHPYEFEFDYEEEEESSDLEDHPDIITVEGDVVNPEK